MGFYHLGGCTHWLIIINILVIIIVNYYSYHYWG
jgi:hypothetical protein